MSFGSAGCCCGTKVHPACGCTDPDGLHSIKWPQMLHASFVPSSGGECDNYCNTDLTMVGGAIPNAFCTDGHVSPYSFNLFYMPAGSPILPTLPPFLSPGPTGWYSPPILIETTQPNTDNNWITIPVFAIFYLVCGTDNPSFWQIDYPALGFYVDGDHNIVWFAPGYVNFATLWGVTMNSCDPLDLYCTTTGNCPLNDGGGDGHIIITG